MLEMQVPVWSGLNLLSALQVAFDVFVHLPDSIPCLLGKRARLAFLVVNKT